MYVRRFPHDGSPEVRVSDGGGSTPRWPGAGHEIVYRTDDQRVMAAAYTVGGNTFAVGARHPWSETTLADTGVLPNFDSARDGSRIAALVPATGADSRQTRNHVTMMLNFFDLLGARAEH